MWVFGYGSLMWDGWERDFDGQKHPRARLKGYRRAFNKKSTRNWGSQKNPGPTLGLEKDDDSECIGCAFKFADDWQQNINDCLKDREGPSFELKKQPIILADNKEVQAIVPINKRSASTYIGDLSLHEKAKMARLAIGSSGSCVEYVRNVRKNLVSLEVEDPYVEDFWEELS